MKYSSRYASFCLKCVLLSGTPKLEFWPKTGVLDCSWKNLIFVQNTKTGGFHPKLEFSSCKNIDALGLPKTGVLLFKTGVFTKTCKNWQFWPKLEVLKIKNQNSSFAPKLEFWTFPENMKKCQNWRCSLKTGSFVIWKLWNLSAWPKLEFSCCKTRVLLCPGLGWVFLK